jgi:2-methylisocitrate lyase-like PEP mutase family enzyme
MAIRGVVDLPLVVDADTGFGNALNVSHTVRALERAGASAVQLEDQRAPKRCGHFDGKELIVADEMVSKIKAAVDSRRENVVVIARRDACVVEGFEAAIERAGRYIDAGADMTFVEAPNSLEELKEIPKRLRAPQLLNIVLGGKTPIVDRKSCEDMGYSFVLYANAALQGMLLGMRTALRTLREKGVLDERDGCIASFAERQRLVGKEKFDEMERSYAHSSIT